ncbi:MAG: hypothetical protein AB9869_05485 [Verrucomicrobiia bacterium]
MNLNQFDQLPPAEKMEAFHQAHGGECYRDPKNNRLYYSDGAVLDDYAGGSFYFPPDPSTEEGEYRLACLKLKFAQLKLKRAVREFDDLNTHLAHSLPGDPDAALEKLKRLQGVVEERKKLVAQAEEALANTRRGKAQAQARREQEEENRRILEWQSRRAAIRI